MASGATIVTSDPVNRGHPLNLGRAAWWLSLPHLMGGQQWFDLMGTSHGALTNMTSATTSGWDATTRPGGWGHVRFNGTNNTVLINNASLGTGGPSVAVAAWVYPTSTPAGAAEIIKKDSSYILRFGSSNSIQGFVWGGPNLQTTETPAGAAPNGTWTRVAMAYSATAGTMVVAANGVPVASAAVSGNVATSSSSPTIGAAAGISEVLGAYLDDITIWANNPLAISSPAAFLALDHDLSRRGYPGALNRR